MRRRDFLAALASATTAALVDPEALIRELARPSRTYFDIGARPWHTDDVLEIEAISSPLRQGDVIVIDGIRDMNGLPAMFVVTADTASGSTNLRVHPPRVPRSAPRRMSVRPWAAKVR